MTVMRFTDLGGRHYVIPEEVLSRHEVDAALPDNERLVGLEMEPGADLEAALALWRSALGPEHVIEGGAEVDAANLATFTPSGRIIAIIRPSTTAEVVQCMRAAQQCRVPIYAVSRGRNWCYGSRTPPRGSAVLMELGRMNRILELNEELAYVRLEPGVTFDQLSTFLSEHASNLQIEVTAGPPDGSLVGNALERGRSHGPTDAASRPVGDFEAVLPDGRRIHSSSRRFPHARHAATEPFPVGPDITGLFFESNLAVVTEMTLWLARKPRHSRVLRLGLADRDALSRSVTAIRTLMLEGVLPAGAAFFMNDVRRAHGLRAGNHHRVPTEFQLIDRNGEAAARPSQGLPLWPELQLAWLCTVTLYSSDLALVERRLQIVKEALGPLAAAMYEGILSNVGAAPNPEYGRNPLWTKPTSNPPDLDRDRVGFIAVGPVAPAIGQDVDYVYETTRRIFVEYGFAPYINLRFWDARSVVFVGSIVYDLDDAAADDRARRCYKSILSTLADRGYVPYRVPTFAMAMLPAPADDWAQFWADVKQAVDPAGILAPGRYDFGYACGLSPAASHTTL